MLLFFVVFIVENCDFYIKFSKILKLLKNSKKFIVKTVDF